jgi:hypothetical protein
LLRLENAIKHTTTDKDKWQQKQRQIAEFGYAKLQRRPQ